MHTTMPKPLCLLVGGTPQKHDYLAELLNGEVHFSVQNSERCIDSARALGAKFVVVFWSRQTNEVAHRLSKNLPDLHVLVENNPQALNGQVERNGFASIFDTRQQLEHVATAIRKLRGVNGSETHRSSRRGPDLAKAFVTHLPALHASVGEHQKLGDNLLNGLVQSTQALKGVLFHASHGENAFSVLSKTSVNSNRFLAPITTDSCLADSIRQIGTVIHQDDLGTPDVISRHMSQLGCNLLVPLESSREFCGWVLLKVHQSADYLDCHSLQSIAYFAAETFRIGENIQETALREAELQAGLTHHMEAVLILDKTGKVTFKSDKGSFLRFKKADLDSFESLSCGQLKRAIRECIEGETEQQKWNFDKNGLRNISVVRLVGGSVLVAVRPESESGDVVKIEANVWRELCDPKKMAYWRTFLRQKMAPSGPPANGGKAYELKNLLSQFAGHRHVSISIPDTLPDVHVNLERFQALEAFLSGLFHKNLKAIQLTAKATADRQLQLEICCERFPSLPSQPENIEADQHRGVFELGILSLIATAVRLKRETCSLGDRWTIELELEKESVLEGLLSPILVQASEHSRVDMLSGLQQPSLVTV